MKYRKKPVVIEAYQTDKELDIETLEGTMHASVGDYIITGVRGEKYPCKPDIFEQTYEPADAPAASPWHRVDEPPQSGQECFTAYRSILRSDPEWLYDICYYTDDLARDCPLMDGAEHRPGWHRYESEYGDVECHPKYWMPVEPPKEDA